MTVEELICWPDTSDLIHSNPVPFTNTRTMLPLAAVRSRRRATYGLPIEPTLTFVLMQPVVSAVVRVRKAHAGAEVVCARALGEAIPPWLGSSDMAVDPDQFVNPALKSSAKTDVEPATETSSESALRGPSFDPSLADTAYVC